MYGNRLPSPGDQQKTVGTLSPFGSDISSRPARSGGLRTVWLAATLSAGFALPAEAQIFWPREYGSDYAEPQHWIEPRRPRVVRTRPKLPDAPKDTAKPVGPIVIAISIENQQMKIYDQNGLFAESPVSTGMRGHSTPMGVFSVIQKNKYHRSNIYSGAPMPYMQRLTWSGIAMHAGALPGYPASHGCIRMPMNFAMRMWGWTRMGARVIVTPGEISPVDVSHPLLIARKPDINPVSAAPAPDKQASTLKSDRSSILDAAAQDKPQLRLTSISEGAPIRTADASGALGQKTDADGGRDGSASEAIKETSKDAKNKAASIDASGEKPVDNKMANQNSEAPKTDKDQARANDPVTSPSVTPPLEGTAEFIGPVKPRTGHVAAYVSAKESKIYVRQNFEPWFEAPVTIAASDRPLGTHVFTARADKANPGALRWSVVSLPAPVRAAEDAPRRRRGEPSAAVTTAAPPSSPTEALDRLTIPEDAMKRIASALAPGGSMTVSDRGLGDETGRGTDFIVPLR